ncbi:MAG: hypothetical protein IJ045_05155 [Ruminiclostridium sp.]|nr:hypothetical protein [Ruminiclostridium sp.]
MVDIIGEIISYEKQAVEIVRSEEKTSKEMLDVAQKVKENIRLKYIAERDSMVKGYRDNLMVTGTQHIHETNDERDEKIKEIESYFAENGEKLESEIFETIING